MPGDPIDRILDTMRRTGWQAGHKGALILRHGTVLTTDPLTVDVAGTTQTADHFYIADRLLQGHTEAVTITGLTSTTGAVDGDEATLAAREPVLQSGDLVLLLTDDDQIFYLIDKVVQAT